MFIMLELIMITSIVLELDGNPEDPLVGDVKTTIKEINKLNLRTKDEQTLLHLCLDYDPVKSIFLATDIRWYEDTNLCI